MPPFHHSDRMEIINTAVVSIIVARKEGKIVPLTNETVTGLLAKMGHVFTSRTTREYVKDIITEVQRRESQPAT